jgi:chemotaxis response regulator CheB
VQSPSDSENAGMPMSALLGDQPDYSALIQQIGPLLVQSAHRRDAQRR